MTRIERSEKRLRRVLEYQFTAKGVTVDDKLRLYVGRKLRELLKKVPRTEREIARFGVTLSQKRPVTGPDSRCVITLYLKDAKLLCSGTTAHHYAAVDIAADNLRQSLLEYKADRYPRRLIRNPKP